jgi:hypothetical protein
MQALCFLLGQRVMHHGVPAVVLLLQTEYLSSEHVARIVTIVRDTLTDRAARLAQRGEGQDSVVSICTASLLVPQSLVRSLLFFNHVLQ